ncbi:MAG: hypothetical protein RIQ81_268 [Pseudomonadota bacterium]|jgi:hypothetical protein
MKRAFVSFISSLLPACGFFSGAELKTVAKRSEVQGAQLTPEDLDLLIFFVFRGASRGTRLHLAKRRYPRHVGLS